MDGANKEFLANPRMFLANNVVVIREGLYSDQIGECLVDLRKDHDIAKDSAGQPLGVYSAVPLPKKTTFGHQFKACYLPWGGNTYYIQNLNDPTVNYFFTPGLTGCTFTWSGGQNPRVAHFNYVDGSDTIDQARIDRKAAKKYGSLNFRQFEKADYKDDVARFVFIVGWRESVNWAFFAQHLIWSDIQGSARVWIRDKATARLGYTETL